MIPDVSSVMTVPPAVEQVRHVSLPGGKSAESGAPAQSPEPVLDLDTAVQAVQQHFDRMQAQLQFRTDESSGRLVVSVVDSRDGTLLRQLPSEVVLRIAQQLDEYQARLVEEMV